MATKIPDPLCITGIKDSLRHILFSNSSTANYFSLFKKISKEKANFIDINESGIKDFSFLSPNLNNYSHRKVLGNLPDIKIENSSSVIHDGSIEMFFAKKFDCNKSDIVVLPYVDDFIKYYLSEYLLIYKYNTKYWKSKEGQGKLLAAAF